MQNNNRKVFDSLVSRTKIYLEYVKSNPNIKNEFKKYYAEQIKQWKLR